MSSGIYVIEDRETKECLYVGQSKDLAMRQRKHLQKLKNGSHPRKDFVEWFKLNGGDRLQFHIVETELETDAELNSSEIWWFNKLSPRFYGKYPSLNETWVHSQETKEKIQSAMRALPGYIERVNKTCPQCSKVFETVPSRGVYCSKACYNLNTGPAVKFPPPEESELRQFYIIEKQSLRALGKHYGVSRTTVQKWCRQYKLHKNAAVA